MRPGTGYAASVLTYTVDGQDAPILYSASEGYYFYMPAAEVTVNVAFEYATYALNSACLLYTSHLLLSLLIYWQ